MPEISDHFIVGVHAPPRWTGDLIGNVEWGENTASADLDALRSLESVAPSFAIPTTIEDRIAPICKGHPCKVRVRYFTPTQLRNNWRLVTPRDTRPVKQSLGRFSEWMDAVVEKVLLSTTINGAVLRTYIVLAKRLEDNHRVRLQVVPYVGEFMVPGIIIPFPDETYRVRSEQMTSVYVGLPVIAHSTEKQAGRKWHTFWYRARLDTVNTLWNTNALIVVDGPYAENPPFRIVVERGAPLLPGNASVREALLERGHQVGGHSEKPGTTYHRLDLASFDGEFPITYIP